MSQCVESGCAAPVKARGMCASHYNRWHYRQDPERHRERAKKWTREHPQEVTLRNSQRDRAVMAERQRRVYHSDPETARARAAGWRRANLDKVRQIQRKYRKTHPAALAEKNRLRYQRELAAAGEATQRQIEARVAYFGWRCWMCGRPWECIDHVIPIALGGAKWPANVRPSCGSCNSRKGARRP